MSASIGKAIDEALTSQLSPWKICRPPGNFQIYSLQQDLSGSTAQNVPKARLITSNDREWTPSDHHPLELAVVPIITGRYAASTRLSVGPVGNLQGLFEKMKIPVSTLSSFLDNGIQFNNYPGPTPHEESFILNFRQWAVVWHADKRNSTAKAIVLMMGGSWAQYQIGNHVKTFLSQLAERRVDCETPGLLAVLLCARNIAESVADLDENAFRTERRLREVIEGGDLKHEDELGKLSAAHSWLASRSIREKGRLSAAAAFLEHALVFDPENYSVEDKQIRRHDLKALHNVTASLSNQAAKLCEESAMHLSTIYNLIAQRDQATNLAIAAASREIALQSKLDQSNSLAIAEASKKIAEETRKDSNAMKMIAIVTMAYLPGTFVATCFSMGIFEWSAKASQVVNPRIWVYFLFTGVLTLLTVGSFMFWTRWQGTLTQRHEGIEAQTQSNPSSQIPNHTSQEKPQHTAVVNDFNPLNNDSNISLPRSVASSRYPFPLTSLDNQYSTTAAKNPPVALTFTPSPDEKFNYTDLPAQNTGNVQRPRSVSPFKVDLSSPTHNYRRRSSVPRANVLLPIEGASPPPIQHSSGNLNHELAKTRSQLESSIFSDHASHPPHQELALQRLPPTHLIDDDVMSGRRINPDDYGVVPSIASIDRSSLLKTRTGRRRRPPRSRDNERSRSRSRGSSFDRDFSFARLTLKNAVVSNSPVTPMPGVDDQQRGRRE